MGTRFDGKIAVITGVGDKGIGSAIAERIASEGGALALLWHERPNRLIARLRKREIPFIDVPCDVTDPELVRAAIDDCMSEFGQVDILVNNAGVEIPQLAEDVTDADWSLQLDVNLTGAMQMIRTALPYLTQPGGVVINIASVLGMAGCAGYTAYSASKAGLIGFTRSLAMELAPHRQRAVCVAPALVHTPMIHRHLDSLTHDMIEQVNLAHPVGLGTVHDVANAVAFLASDEASWITGVSLPLGWVEGFAVPLAGFDSRNPAVPAERPVIRTAESPLSSVLPLP